MHDRIVNDHLGPAWNRSTARTTRGICGGCWSGITSVCPLAVKPGHDHPGKSTVRVARGSPRRARTAASSPTARPRRAPGIPHRRHVAEDRAPRRPLRDSSASRIRRRSCSSRWRLVTRPAPCSLRPIGRRPPRRTCLPRAEPPVAGRLREVVVSDRRGSWNPRRELRRKRREFAHRSRS